MHICHVITRGDIIGGAQSHVRDLSIEQINNGHSISIVCGESTKVFSDLNVTSLNCIQSLKREIRPLQDILSIFSLVKIIIKTKPDIIACHTSKAGVIGRIAGTLLNKKVIYTPHGWIFSEPSYSESKDTYFRIEKYMAILCNKIITVSQYDYNLAKTLKLSKPNKLEKVHNGISDIDKKYIKSTYQKNKIVKLITVARIEDPKDYETLLTALSSLKNRNWELSIIGDGSNKEKFEKLSMNLNIDKNTTFHGDCDDVARRLYDADVFLLISKSEGFPISIIEAMRAGLPVIASNVGGVSESVFDKETGILVEKEAPAALEKAIETLQEDKELIEKYGRKGRDYYKKFFTSEEMIKNTQHIYNGLVNA